MSICGDTCTIASSALGSFEGHRFVIELGSNEIDTRIFGDQDYGSFIACALNGSVNVDSYKRPDVEIGDSLTATVSVGTEEFKIPCIVTNQSINVDAKDVVQFTTKMRIENDIIIHS